MSTLIFLLLVAAAVYVLWFHKFTLPDGTEIKGWLAKNKAEKGNAPAAPATNAPQQEEDNNVPDEGYVHDQSTKADFDELLDRAALADPFGNGMDMMQEYVGWMLIAAGRTGASGLNIKTVWKHLSDAWVENEDIYRRYYKDKAAKGEAEPWQVEKMPAWFVDVNFLNGYATFIQNAPGHFDDATMERINEWAADLHEARQGHTAIQQEANAAEYLVRLYTILRGEDDSMIAANTEAFKQKYKFPFELPQF